MPNRGSYNMDLALATLTRITILIIVLGLVAVKMTCGGIDEDMSKLLTWLLRAY